MYPPSSPPLRSKVNDVVSTFEHVQIMLYNHDSVPGISELLKCENKLLDIHKMQSRRGFVKIHIVYADLHGARYN